MQVTESASSPTPMSSPTPIGDPKSNEHLNLSSKNQPLETFNPSSKTPQRWLLTTLNDNGYPVVAGYDVNE